MATATAAMTIDQYLQTSFSPDVDFVDGGIEENWGERDHAGLQSLLAAFFVALEDKLNVISCTGQRIRMAGDRVRICDFTLLRSDAPYEEVLITAPLLCIEIMSPDDPIKSLEGTRGLPIHRSSAHLVDRPTREACLHLYARRIDSAGRPAIKCGRCGCQPGRRSTISQVG